MFDGMYTDFALFVSHFQSLNRSRGNTHKPDRKTGWQFNWLKKQLGGVLGAYLGAYLGAFPV